MTIYVKAEADAHKLLAKFQASACTINMHVGRKWLHFGTLSGQLNKAAIKSLEIHTYLKLCFSLGIAYCSKRVRQDLQSIKKGNIRLHVYAPKNLQEGQAKKIQTILSPATIVPASAKMVSVLTTHVASIATAPAQDAPNRREALMQEIKQRLLDRDFFMAKKKARELVLLYPNDTDLHKHAEVLTQESGWEVMDESNALIAPTDYQWIDQGIATCRATLYDLQSKAKSKFDKAFLWLGQNIFDSICELRHKPDVDVTQIKESYKKWSALFGWETGHLVDPFANIFNDGHPDICNTLNYFHAEDIVKAYKHRKCMEWFKSALDKIADCMENQIEGKTAKEIDTKLAESDSSNIPKNSKYLRATMEKKEKYMKQFQVIANGDQPEFPEMEEYKEFTEALQKVAQYKTPPSPTLDEVIKRFEYQDAAQDFTAYVKQMKVFDILRDFEYKAHHLNAEMIKAARDKDNEEIYKPKKQQLIRNITLALRQYPFEDLDHHLKAMEAEFPGNLACMNLRMHLPYIEGLLKTTDQTLKRDEVQREFT